MQYNCSLQINLAPNDYRHVIYLLPHQLKILSSQVDEVVLTLDTHRSKGRFGENWEENLLNIKQFINSLCSENKKIRLAEVDYSASISKEIARFFFGGDFIPKKDYRGGPFYAYFYGLYACKSDYVFHLDSDIFLGGLSQTWVKEAIELFEQNDDLLICSPLPGPPHPEKILIGQSAAIRLSDFSFEFKGMSTRIFMLKKSTFSKHKIELQRPGLKNMVKATIKKNPPYSLPEDLLSDCMHKYHLRRIDFLGEGKGLWSLHPPYRTADFYNRLPEIIKNTEDNTLHPMQNGFYDIIDEVCDWTEAKEKLKNNRWWKKSLHAKATK